jgi:4-amino-4-deoxy-L-arabinose transferase-like glycosyltransferase
MNPEEYDAGAPVSSGVRGRTMLRAVGGACALVALWSVLQLWGLGEIPFHTHGEPREALVVWEMTHAGGWILPLRNGSEVPSKPPLFHWLGALGSLASGRTDEWSVRLPSATLSLAGALITYAVGLSLWGPAEALMGATILLTSFEWERAATSARVDMTLTFGLLIAFFAYLFHLEGRTRLVWLAGFYGGMALAALAKGPIGIALPVLVVAFTTAARRDFTPLRRLHVVRGLTVVLAIAGLWYVAALVAGGSRFVAKQILDENLLRLFAGDEYEGGHLHSPLYLVGGLATGFLPWTLFLPAPLMVLWSQRRATTARAPEMYLLLVVLVVLLFYSIPASKRSVYLLAAYPALALFVARWWAAAARDAPNGAPIWLCQAWRVIAWAATAVMAALLLTSVAEVIGMPLIGWVASRVAARDAHQAEWVAAGLRQRWLVSLFLLAVATAALRWLARSLERSRWRAAFAAVAVAQAAAIVLVQQVVLPQVAAHKTPRDFMRAVREVIGEGQSPQFYRGFDYGAIFYWGGHIPRYDGDLAVDAPRHLLMRRSEWDKVPAMQRQGFEVVDLPLKFGWENRRRLVLVRRKAP